MIVRKFIDTSMPIPMAFVVGTKANTFNRYHFAKTFDIIFSVTFRIAVTNHYCSTSTSVLENFLSADLFQSSRMSPIKIRILNIRITTILKSILVCDYLTITICRSINLQLLSNWRNSPDDQPSLLFCTAVLCSIERIVGLLIAFLVNHSDWGHREREI